MDSEFETRKRLFEQHSRVLVGECIVGVQYHEIDYGTPYWNSEHLHSVDHGIDFKMESGLVYFLTWDSEFVQYGLSLKKTSGASWLRGSKVWDVSSDDNWIPLLHRAISGVDVYWSYFGNLEDNSRDYYPQDMVITFVGGDKVFIGASEYRWPEMFELFAEGTDNVTVVFSDNIARRHRIGPYAPSS